MVTTTTYDAKHIRRLEGLEAVTPAGARLGRVDHFRTTPGNTVVVVRGEREHWIPFVKDRIVKVDLEAGRMALLALRRRGYSSLDGPAGSRGGSTLPPVGKATSKGFRLRRDRSPRSRRP